MKCILFLVYASLSMLPASVHAQSTILQDKKLELVKRFAPLVKLDKEEKYFPSSVDWFVYRNQLRKKKKGGDEILRQVGQMRSAAELAPYTTDNYYLSIQSDSKLGINADTTKEGEQKPTPGLPYLTTKAYANFVEKPDGGAVIQYLFFYPYNGVFQAGKLFKGDIGLGKIVGTVTKAFDIGSHDGDWEHVDVHIYKQGNDYAIRDVYFARHRPSQDGAFAVPEMAGTHPIVYSSKYGHASHEHYAEVYADKDKTSSNGPEWHLWDSIELAAVNGQPTKGNEWLNFGGGWGSPDSPKAPSKQGWWRYKAPQEFPDTTKGNKPMAQVEVFAPSVTAGLQGQKNFPPYVKTVGQAGTKHTQNSDTFKIDTSKLPTYIRKLIWHTEVPLSLANQPITYTLYTSDHKPVGSARLSPTERNLITPLMSGDYYIGSVRIGNGINKDSYTFTVTVNGVND